MNQAPSFGRIAGSALTTRQFLLLYAAMLIAAAGNTALQSVMPAIGRAIEVPDLYVALTFSTSAALWVAFAPIWARLADGKGRKPLILLGVGAGFTLSSLLCGIVLLLGLKGLVGPLLTFILFAVVRGFYGIFGCATPSATQAYLAAKTRRSARVNALAGLASSFSLGTIVGPALAPLFVLPFLGLSGPLFVFAVLGALVFAFILAGLPNDLGRRRGRGAAMSYPSVASPPTGASVRAATGQRMKKRLRWHDPRIRGWILAGVASNHAMAAILTVVGFFTIDRLGLDARGSEREISLVMMAGAAATLAAQWGLIPRLGWSPRMLVLVGSLVAALGMVATMLADSLYAIVLGFAIQHLGFGLVRPGFTAGASLAVPLAEQGGVAGIVTSANGLAFVAAPTLGILAYGVDALLPFTVCAAILLILVAWGWRRL
ncbi:MFS transporter [Sphingomicrobium lutaoense]|uniref:MFS family permease n=1 Tax=Sphingomicrobium lutaoense TaxID=515949 RepID=A0A839Z038_9SPHN|nr:MFS transporter [Sphingomicrobium lutaoense]MBB3764626.1 MFS family permease [Sphingomicrobium lutaoense]